MIIGDGDEPSRLDYYFTQCTKKQKVVFSGNATQCRFVEGDACNSRLVPSPCQICDEIQADMPEDSYMRDARFRTYKELLLSISGGVTFGCSGEYCKMVLDGFPLEFGELRCAVGRRCEELAT